MGGGIGLGEGETARAGKEKKIQSHNHKFQRGEVVNIGPSA